jgi:hypothetical protein
MSKNKNRRYWTVIGVYKDNNQVWMEHSFSFSPSDAAKDALAKMAKLAGSGDPVVADVIKGKHFGTLKNGYLVRLNGNVLNELKEG